ncbi:hypothetical protein KZZ52_16025 [Dactylosporangium sp. AC04546]|uniref:hypothetical protein n=1 Tax=Dactylosporangium sp. AC04546 TaxID=2862460 RepID=UPI001EE12145|nr:hypothetical protein [Dactylosporangium sp. AC04546]WVK86811.1 hypothetical protein KZZ52_16025 [Dactylosporangium sp. AC04546]
MLLLALCGVLLWQSLRVEDPEIVVAGESISVDGFKLTEARLDSDTSYRLYWIGPSSKDVIASIRAPALVLNPPRSSGLTGFTALAEGESTINGQRYTVFVDQLDLGYWSAEGRRIPEKTVFGLEGAQVADLNGGRTRLVALYIVGPPHPGAAGRTT